MQNGKFYAWIFALLPSQFSITFRKRGRVVDKSRAVNRINMICITLFSKQNDSLLLNMSLMMLY